MASMQVGDEFLLDCESCVPFGQSGQGQVLLHGSTCLANYKEVSDCLESAVIALRRREVPKCDLRWLSTLMTELLENAYRHGVCRRGVSEKFPPLFELFEVSSGLFCVRVSNLVDSSVCANFDLRLKELAKMPKSEVAEHYWTRMQKKRISVTGGAGAGLLSIFRLALRVTHKFEPVNPCAYYFSIRAYYQTQSA